MARPNKSIPLMKFVATGVGLALCGVDTWLNAEHIAHVEGWASSLVGRCCRGLHRSVRRFASG
jgi:hypothetical protein